MRRLALLMLLGACGYRVTAPNTALPGGVRSLSVELLQNRTAEPGAEVLLTSALREHAARAGLDAPAPEAVLTGTVLGVSSAPLLASATRPTAPTYRLSLTVQLTLSRDGAALSQTTFSTTEEYPSGPDALLSESNRAAALRRLVQSAAREGFERLATGW